jgi:hypothetical protein
METVFIATSGDMSVGIPNTTISFDLYIDLLSTEEKEWVRNKLEKCFSELYDEKVVVTFLEEIETENKKIEELYP